MLQTGAADSSGLAWLLIGARQLLRSLLAPELSLTENSRIFQYNISVKS